MPDKVNPVIKTSFVVGFVIRLTVKAILISPGKFLPWKKDHSVAVYWIAMRTKTDLSAWKPKQHFFQALQVSLICMLHFGWSVLPYSLFWNKSDKTASTISGSFRHYVSEWKIEHDCLWNFRTWIPYPKGLQVMWQRKIVTIEWCCAILEVN